MDSQYINYPWGADAYICPGCRNASFRLFIYCPHCGVKQDPRKVFKPRADRPAVTDINEVRKILASLRGFSVRLWDYCVSHCVLQLRVAHGAADEVGNGKNTVIVCGGTDFVKVPTHGWHAYLSLEQFQGKYKRPWSRLVDEKASVFIECEAVCIYEKMPARYFGARLKA